MKTLLLFTVCFFSLWQFKAQHTFNRAYHASSEVAIAAAFCIDENYYHLVSQMDQSAFRQSFLYKHSVQGLLKYSKPVFPNKQLRINRAFRTSDDGILILCEDYQCDLISFSGENSYLIKMDTMGNVVFNTPTLRQFQEIWGDVGVNFLDGFKNGLQNADGSYSVFTDSVMYKFSYSGQFVSRHALGIDSISSVLLLANGNILADARMGMGRFLFVISSNGTIVSSHPFVEPLIKMSFYDGTKIVGLGLNGKLYKISPTFHAISNSNNAGSMKVRDFIVESDTLYNILSDDNTNKAYSYSDTSFISIYYSPVSTKSLSPEAICKNKNTIALVGTSTSDKENSLGRNYFSSLSAFHRDSVPIYSSDIALISAESDTAYYTLSYSTLYNTSYDLSIRIKFKIKNSGTVPISNFKFSCATNFYSAECSGMQYHQQIFTGINLAPGDSMELKSPIINKYAQINNSGYSYPGIPQKHCVFLSVPNGEIDFNPENNEKCATEGFGGLGIETNLLSGNKINLFPNPFVEGFFIESDVLIKRIEVLNSLGELIKDDLVNDVNANIYSPGLSLGIYLVKIETEKGTITKKIIKQ